MNHFKKLSLVLAISASLVACGGSTEDDDRFEYDRDDVINDGSIDNSNDEATDDGSVETDTNGYVSALITDNLSRDYAEVWVTLHSIEILTASGSSATVYESIGGTPVNLSQLVDVSQLLGQQAVAAGAYTTFNVELGNQINLTDKNGNVINATFGNGVELFDIVVDGELVVSQGQASSLTLDFDLAQFVYDANSGLVTPTVVQFNDDSREQRAELHGSVQAVYDNYIEVVSDKHANVLKVNISNGTVIYDEASRQSSNAIALITVGDYVEIYGDYDAATSSVVAANVRIEDDYDGSDFSSDNDSYYEVEGLVVSYDGSTLVLDVREANFLPDGNTVNITGVANAGFEAGSLSDLKAGQWLEINGQWDGQTFSANYVEIEGGLTDAERDSESYDNSYLEVEGVITSVDSANQQFVVTVSDSDDNGFVIGASVTVNYTGAWLSSQAQSCLIAGSYVEAKGALSNSVVAAKRIEFEGACGGFSDYSYVDDSADERSGDDDNHSDDDYDNTDSHDDNDSNDNDDIYGSDLDHEAEGLIISLRDGSLTLRVSEVEGFNPGSTTIEVDITNAWYEDGTAANLALNRFIEVEGFWDGTQLIASKVEFD